LTSIIKIFKKVKVFYELYLQLIIKLSPIPPAKTLVERYLIEIARSHHVQFEPDPSVMEPDVSNIYE